LQAPSLTAADCATMDENHELIPLPLATIRLAFTELGQHINTVLRIQVGDIARLEDAKRNCLRLLGTLEQVGCS
jgi:hypothetical protein